MLPHAVIRKYAETKQKHKSEGENVYFKKEGAFDIWWGITF